MIFRFALVALAMGASAQDLADIPSGETRITDSVTGLELRVSVPAFRMGRTEVVQKDFQRIVGRNPSAHRGDDLPVENVMWWDAILYCNLRSEAEGLQPCYDLATGSCDRSCNGYRLPTEAEWTQALGPGKPVGNLRPAGTKNTAALREAMGRGTSKAGSAEPNQYGLYDMTGNVWEWVNDRYAANPVVDLVVNPGGPGIGPDRVIRGGSFLSTAAQWNKGLRSSRDPRAASPFTGFRVARNADSNRPTIAPRAATPPLSAQLESVRRTWLDVLGAPKIPPFIPAVRTIETVNDRVYTADLMELQVEPDQWERVLVMRPHTVDRSPRPVLIVPFYDVDTPAGRDLGGRRFTPPSVRSFAYMAVQRGYIAVAIRWFGESYGEGYDEAVANLAGRHPGCTGLGKWVWDSQRLLDFVATLPGADTTRTAMMGHSLGGKMALYAAAFDPRIAAVVSSEPGIGLKLSNFDDFWYLGENISKLPQGADQDQLLSLIAPRPFLLIGGEDSDGDKSVRYLDAARPAYAAHGAADKLKFINHRKGHTPTPESLQEALDWLGKVLE